MPLKTDIDSYYSRLNNIRKKFGLGTVSVPNIEKGITPNTSEQMKTYDNLMTITASDRSKWLNKNLSLGDLSVGARTLHQTDINIKQMLSTWEGTCYHNSDNSNYGDCGDYSDKTDNGDQVDCNEDKNHRINDGSYRTVCSSASEYKGDNNRICIDT